MHKTKRPHSKQFLSSSSAHTLQVDAAILAPARWEESADFEQMERVLQRSHMSLSVSHVFANGSHSLALVNDIFAIGISLCASVCLELDMLLVGHIFLSLPDFKVLMDVFDLVFLTWSRRDGVGEHFKRCAMT